jgi:hypothetical protein
MKDDPADIGWDAIVKRPKEGQSIQSLNLKHISNFKKERYVSDLNTVYFEIYSRLEDFSRQIMPNPSILNDSPRS